MDDGYKREIARLRRELVKAKDLAHIYKSNLEAACEVIADYEERLGRQEAGVQQEDKGRSKASLWGSVPGVRQTTK